MTRQEYNTTVASVIKLAVLNNAGSVSRALKKSGYPSKDFIPNSELESALFTLYVASPDKFFEVLRNVQWNYGNNNGTNDPKNLDPIIQQLSNETGSTVSKSDWWGTIVTVLSNAFIPSSHMSPAQADQISPWKRYTILIVSALIISGLIYWGIKSLK